MKKINVKVKIVNDLKEEILTDVIGDFDEEKNIISYNDEKVFVRVIIGEKITMKRSHPDYNLELIFEENKKNLSMYEIINPKMNLEIEAETMVLRRCNNDFYTEYKLKLNSEEIGLFSIDFKLEE